LNGFTIG